MRFSLGLCILVALWTAFPTARGADDLTRRRGTMIKEQIENRGISNKRVLDAMRAVERHRFVPEKLISRAYSDSALPIGQGQTISQPYIVAYMTDCLDPRPGQTALEIGTGSGYQAAVLSLIVDAVYTVEVIPKLATSAAARLKELGYDNVEVKTGDGYYGWEEHAPFDMIIVTAASSTIPPPLKRQLKDGGKMMIPIGPRFGAQCLVLVERHGDEFTTTRHIPVRFVPFTRSD